jgi:nucleotide-binding universal stress UspA family protein
MNATAAPAQDAGYASIMVPLHLGAGAEDRVRLAASLAERFKSRLIGIAAEEFVVPYIGEGAMGVDAVLVEEAQRTAAENIARAETLFRRNAGKLNDIEWRCAVADTRSFVLSQARAADILVVARRGSSDESQGRMALSPGDLVMDLGRPLIVVPPEVGHLSAKHAVVAWKDTREARRAVRDSLPFLKAAEIVTVLSVGSGAEDQGAADVGAYLALHGVTSRAVVRPGRVRSVADEITSFAGEHDADLIVCGAYGHSRMREWMFGGMTQDLLESTPVCCLMSH